MNWQVLDELRKGSADEQPEKRCYDKCPKCGKTMQILFNLYHCPRCEQKEEPLDAARFMRGGCKW